MRFLNTLFLVVVSVLTSCVGDLDFDQANDFSATPTYAVPLLNFEFNQQEELGNISIPFLPLTPPEELTIPTTSNKDLEKVVFQFEASNSFNGDFTIVVTLLDKDGLETHKFDDIVIDAGNENYTDEVEISLIANPDVFNSISVRGQLSYNGSIIATDPGVLSFKSAGIFYYTIE